MHGEALKPSIKIASVRVFYAYTQCFEITLTRGGRDINLKNLICSILNWLEKSYEDSIDRVEFGLAKDI